MISVFKNYSGKTDSDDEAEDWQRLRNPKAAAEVCTTALFYYLSLLLLQMYFPFGQSAKYEVIN